MRFTLTQIFLEDGDVGSNSKAGQRGNVTHLTLLLKLHHRAPVHFQWLPP